MIGSINVRAIPSDLHIDMYSDSRPRLSSDAHRLQRSSFRDDVMTVDMCCSGRNGQPSES